MIKLYSPDKMVGIYH